MDPEQNVKPSILIKKMQRAVFKVNSLVTRILTNLMQGKFPLYYFFVQSSVSFWFLSTSIRSFQYWITLSITHHQLLFFCSLRAQNSRNSVFVVCFQEDYWILNRLTILCNYWCRDNPSTSNNRIHISAFLLPPSILLSTREKVNQDHQKSGYLVYFMTPIDWHEKRRHIQAKVRFNMYMLGWAQ